LTKKLLYKYVIRDIRNSHQKVLLFLVVLFFVSHYSYAQSQLSFHANAGTGSMDSLALTSYSSVNVPSCEFSYFGHHFIEWNTQADGSGSAFSPYDSYTSGAIDTAAADAVLYAQWGKYCGGDGSASHPWIICSPEALILLSQSVSDWDKHFLQTSDIDFSNDLSTIDWDGNGVLGELIDLKGFSPIGNTVASFTGKYDGQTYSINRLYVNNDKDYTGLFGLVDSAQIIDVTLKDAQLSGLNYIGGIIGRARNNSQLKGLDFDGFVIGRAFVGGVTGSIENSELSMSAFRGNVAASGSMVGGLSGRVSASTIMTSYSAGSVVGDLQNVGGIAGFVQDNSLIKNTYSTAGVMGQKYVGSFAGILSGSAIEHCYATGAVIGDDFVGGFMGINGSSTLTDCYYDYETTWSDVLITPGLTALTKADFSNTFSYFNSWSFGNNENNPWVYAVNGRPFLYWQELALSNGLMKNATAGYSLDQPTLIDASNVSNTVGVRYRTLNETTWSYVGDALFALPAMAKDDYFVQSYATSDDASYYGDMTLMALHTLSFDANNGVGTMPDVILSAKDSVELPSHQFSWSGYNFSRWNTASDSSGTSFSDNDKFAIGQTDSTLYALWTAHEFLIDYQLYGGENSPLNPSTYTVDSLVVLQSPTKTGYTFDAWYVEDSFKTSVAIIPLASKQDTTLHAKWNVNTYGVVYHANTASATSIADIDTFGHTVNLRANSFSNGYLFFKNWSTEADGSGDVYEDKAPYTYGDSTLHLYAQWQKYCGGFGTKESPWVISCAQSLILLSQSPEDWDNYFVQDSNIVFDDSMALVDWNNDGIYNDAAGFSPIGNMTTPFSGHYEGNNLTIENLYINRPTQDNVGLFAYATSDSIKGIALVNVDITGGDNTGALLGNSAVNTLYNCYSNGLVNGKNNVGGLIGTAHGLNLKNSYSTCGVTGVKHVGGLLGSVSDGYITHCYSAGVVLGESYSAGLVANASTSFFTGCYYDNETSQQEEGSAYGAIAGIEALSTEAFKANESFVGWNIGIGIELLPWMPSAEGRPYLVGQQGSVSNGVMINCYQGYRLSHAYADSVASMPQYVGIRYRNVNDSLWLNIQDVYDDGSIGACLSGLTNGDYWVQAYSVAAGATTYGDMTLMSLATLHFEANGAYGTMEDSILVVGHDIYFPTNHFVKDGFILKEWNTMADASGVAFSPLGQFAIGANDTTLHAIWMEPFATDDYFDGIVGGATVEIDVTHNDTIGGVPYAGTNPIEILSSSTSAVVTIEDGRVVYSPDLTFSGPDFFTYLVEYNGAIDTADVVVLVFDAPGNMVNADCYVQMPKYEWEVQSAGVSPDANINPWTTPLVGDLFGDAYPEIVAKNGDGFTDDKVYVYYGSATPLQSGRSHFKTVEYNAAATTMAIAKIQTPSGLRPTLFVAGIDRRLYAYNPENGDEYWSSANTNDEYYCAELGDNEGAIIGVADFNNDSEQEVYAGNRIYNAATGALLCSGGDSTDIGYFKYGATSTENYSNPSHHMMHSVTGDFNRDGDLGLAAGRYVFDVDIANGTMPIHTQLPTNASSDPNMIKDGITVVADMDIDGDLDVIVVHQTTRNDIYCYVWDGQTPTLMAEKHIYNADADDVRYAVGVPFIGDLDGDGRPEIAFTASNRQYAFYYDDLSTTLQKYYVLEHTDRSGFTGLTLFDFNNDKIAEIVYRDETDLRIINASGISHLTGNDTLNADGTPILYNLASYSCYSSTQSEFAVVADVDLDEQAEIVVTNYTRLNVFESGTNSKWVAARPVWNQYGYNVTNVNNDLTIPRYSINNSMAIELDSFTMVRPFNHFLQQMGNVTLKGENVLLTPDLYMSNSFYTNDGTTGTLTFDIVNQGDIDFKKQDSTISFYCGDPALGASLLAVRDIPEDIAWEDTLKGVTYTFQANPATCPRIFVRLNDNGRSTFPDINNIQEECNYENNTMLAAIFELSSHFTWNGFDLDNVSLSTGDTSSTDGMIHMLVSRGDTLDLLPQLDGYVFRPNGSTLPEYVVNDDTLTLENVQENGTFSFTAYKIPEMIFKPQTVVYDQTKHRGDVTVSSKVTSQIFYRNTKGTEWATSQPDSVGSYDMKVVSSGNYLYTAYADSVDSILTITPRPISFSLDVDDKPYDSSDSITAFSSVNDALSGDQVVLDINNEDLHFAKISVGEHKIYPSANWSISGADANNYTIQPYDTVLAHITKHVLTITANDTARFYNGEPFFGGNGVTYEGFAVGEDTSILSGSLNYVATASSQGALDHGSYVISVDGFSSDNYDIVYVDGALTIEKKFLFVEFDGTGVITYGDSINLMDYQSPNVLNLAPGDSFIHEALGLYEVTSTTGNLIVGVHKLDIGNAHIINAAGVDKTSNYNISFSSDNITVLPKELLIVDAIAQDKVYDATTYASITGATLSGVIPGDVVDLQNSTVGQFIQTDVGSDIEIFHDNTINIAGADASNYILMPFNSTLTANIYPKELILSGTYAEDKKYDGDDIAVIKGSILDGVIGTDDVYLLNDSTGQFSQSDVGNNLVVQSAITIGGNKSHNYYLTQDLELKASIFPVPLSIAANDISKVYDGQLFHGGNGITCDGFVFGEDTNDLFGTLNYKGNSQAVLDTGVYQITPYGYTSFNYDITYLDGILSVMPRLVDLRLLEEDTLVYGSVAFADDYNPSVSNLATSDSLTATLSGFGNDTSTSGYFNVGSRELTIDNVKVWHALYGEVTHNYIFTNPTQTLTIVPKALTVVNAVAEDKVYDNTLAATIDSADLDGLILGDEVTLFDHTTGVFDDENVAEDITVTPDIMSIAGSDANNYTLIQPAQLMADITPRPLTIAAADTTKTYDSFHFAGGNGVFCNGFVDGESYADLAGALSYNGSAQMAVDTGSYSIIPSGYASANYDISYLPGTLRIDPRPMYIDYGGEATITYGSAVDMMNYTPQTADLATNDNFHNDDISFGTDLSTSGHYTAGVHDLEIGDAYILNSSGDTVTYNYIFTFNIPTINIDRLALSIINAEAQDKVYDNTTEALVNGATLSGIVAGDDVMLKNSDKGIFADENVGFDIAVSTDSMTLYGDDINNYVLLPQPVLQADITPRAVYYTLDSVEDKTYDGTNAVTNNIMAVTNDTIYEDGITLDFALQFPVVDVDQDLNIDATVWQLSGAEVHNYTLMPFAGDVASILQADLLFKVQDITRYYGEDNGTLDYEIEGFVNNEDEAVLDMMPSIACSLTPKTFVGEYNDFIQLSGGYDDNYNYIFDQGEVTINKVKVHVNYMGEDSLIYGDYVDGNDYTVATGQMENNDSLYLGTLYFGDDISGSGHYNVGLHKISPGEIHAKDETGKIDVTVNYEITFHPAFITYVAKPVDVDVEALSKNYDGTTAAQLAYNKIMDIYEGDVVDLDMADLGVVYSKSSQTLLDAEFVDKNAAERKAIAPVSYTFSGSDRQNYEIRVPDLEASISKRKVNCYGLAYDKVYDGTNNVVVDTVGLDGVIENDDLNISYKTAHFTQADAGNNLPIDLGEMEITGDDKENYIVENTLAISATIHKADLLVKPHDIAYTYGDHIPEVSFDISGFVNNETLDVIDQQPEVITELQSKQDVGYYSLELGNASDNNYNVNYEPGQVTVLPRPLEIIYHGIGKICSNEPIDESNYSVSNLVLGDELSTLDLDISILEDNSVTSGKKYNVERGLTIIKNERKRKVNDNYDISMDPVQIEILNIPSPMLGEDLEFCGVCEYDFDAGEGISYLWSTGDTTRYMSMQGNFRGNVWVRVENENHCFNSDTVSISVESKYLKEFVVAFIYPNPSLGQFKVELSHFVNDVATIYDMTGNFIKQVDVSGYSFEVDIDVPDGAYVLEIRDAKELFLIENSMMAGLR